jgi:hypothetical protein
MLRAILKNNPELIKPISHLKAINSASFWFICNKKHRVLVCWRFINELGLMDGRMDCMENSAYDIQRMFIDTLSMEKLLLLSPGPIQSVAHLRKRHQRAIDEVNRHKISELEKSKDFPLSPVPAPLPSEDFEIYPLDSPLKLYKEAQEQHNCVFGCYKDKIMESGGCVYIYSMKKPERATVKIVFDYVNRCFLPDEVKGPFNKPVAVGTIIKINDWLSSMWKKPEVKTFYDENSPDKVLPAFPGIIPKPEDRFHIGQINNLKDLILIMRHFNVPTEEDLLLPVEEGSAFAFVMDAPEKVLVFIRKDKGGTFSYRAFKQFRYMTLKHETECRLEEWMEGARIRNLEICDPNQMDFGFAEYPPNLSLGNFIPSPIHQAGGF